MAGAAAGAAAGEEAESAAEEEVEASVVAAEHDRAAASPAAEVVAVRGHRWGVLHHSADPAVEVALLRRHDHRHRQLGHQHQRRGPAWVVEMPVREIVHRYSRGRGRMSERVLVPVLGRRRCRALGPVPVRELDRAAGSPIDREQEREWDKGLPIGQVSRNRQLGCPDWGRLARVCRIRGLAFRIAWRTVRSRFKIGRAV